MVSCLSGGIEFIAKTGTLKMNIVPKTSRLSQTTSRLGASSTQPSMSEWAVTIASQLIEFSHGERYTTGP